MSLSFLLHLVKVAPPSKYSLPPNTRSNPGKDVYSGILTTCGRVPLRLFHFFYRAWYSLASVSYASVPKEQPLALCYLGASAPALPRAGCRVVLALSDLVDL